MDEILWEVVCRTEVKCLFVGHKCEMFVRSSKSCYIGHGYLIFSFVVLGTDYYDPPPYRRVV